MNKIVPLMFSLFGIAAASADGWQYQYQAAEAQALDGDLRVRFQPQAITTLSDGFVVAGTRSQDGTFSGAPIVVRYDESLEIKSVLPGRETTALFSGPDDVLLALDADSASAQDKNGTSIYQWHYDFPTLTGANVSQVQMDAAGNALVLRGARAFLLSRLGVFDLGAASAIAADADALYVARKTASGAQITQIAADGSSTRTFALENDAEVLAFTLDPSNLVVLLSNTSQVVVQRYSRNDFSPGARRIVSLASPLSELTAQTERFTSPVSTDTSWRVLFAGTTAPQLFILDQLGARFISLSLDVPCTATCRWQSTDSGVSIYSVERQGSAQPKRQTVVLDANGSVLDFANDLVDSVNAVAPFAGGRVLAKAGELLAISNDYIGTPVDQSVPASLRSVALLDDQGNSIAIGINSDLELVRHSYINAQGAKIWEQTFALPYSGVATAAENSERYCTALALKDKRIDVRCLEKRSGALVEFETLGPLPSGSEAPPRRLLSSLSADGRLALWIERADSNRSIEYRELSPTVRVLRERVIASGLSITGPSMMLDGRFADSHSDLLYRHGAGIRLHRNGEDQDLGAGYFAQFMPDGGVVIGLEEAVRRLNGDLSPRFNLSNARVSQALSLGELDIYRSEQRLVALDRAQGTVRWDVGGEFAATTMLGANDRLLLLRSSGGKVRAQQRSITTGLPIAERVFDCTGSCTINKALWRAEQVRVQLDQQSELGLRMSVNGMSEPNSVPALSLSHPSLIGTWSNPALAGQSLVINRIANSNLLFAGWNTHSAEPAQASGAQSLRWYVLLGEIAPLTATELAIPIYQSSGGKFQSATPVPTTKALGKAFVRLSSCDQLSLRYDFDDNALDGEVLLQRLLPATYPCLGIPASAATEADAKVPLNIHSNWEGGWYDPNTPGQGFFFNDSRVSESGSVFDLLYGSWQLFDVISNDPHNQHWFTLVGNRGNNQTNFEVKIIQSGGGVFANQAAGAELEVGRGRMSQLDCESMLFSYQFDEHVGQFSQKQGQFVLRKLGGCAR